MSKRKTQSPSLDPLPQQKQPRKTKEPQTPIQTPLSPSTQIQIRKAKETQTPPPKPIPGNPLGLNQLPDELKVKKKTTYKALLPAEALTSPQYAPLPAKIARSRAERTVNVGDHKKYPHGDKNATPEPNVHPAIRIREFPGQGLSEGPDATLVCLPCHQPISLRKGTIRVHLRSITHQTAWENHEQISQEEDRIRQYIIEADKGRRIPGQSLPLDTRVARHQVTKAIIQDNIVRAQFHHGKLKELLERKWNCTFPESEMDAEIGEVCKEVKEALKAELKGVDQMTLVFDACSEVSEVFAIVARYWDNGIKQRLISLRWLQHSLSGRQQACHIVRETEIDLNVNFGTKVVGCIRDGCSVNTACVEQLQVISPLIIDVTCVSHIASRIGEKYALCFPILAEFSSNWSSMLNESNIAANLFHTLSGKSALDKAKVKWFADYEMIEQMSKYWDHVRSVVSDQGDFSSGFRSRMRNIIHEALVLLEAEMAIFLDLCKPLYRLCYVSEGDKFISPLVYDHIEEARSILESITTTNPKTPRLDIVIKRFHREDPTFNIRECTKYFLAKAEPLQQEFCFQFDEKHGRAKQIWKFCRFFHPTYVKETRMQDLQTDLEETVLRPLQHKLPILKASLQIYKGHAVSYVPCGMV